MSDFKIIPGFGIMETALVRRLARTGRLRVRDNAAMYRHITNLRKKLPRSVVIVVRRDAKAREPDAQYRVKRGLRILRDIAA